MWAGFADGQIRSWSLPKFQATLDKQIGAGIAWTAARFSTDAQWLATGDAAGQVRVFGQDGQQVRELDNVEQRTGIESLAWSPIDNRLLAVGAKDGSVELWDPGKTKRLRRFTPFDHGVNGIEFTPDGRWLLVGARAAGMQLWDVATGELLLKGTSASVPFGFSRDGRWLATGDWSLVSFAELVIPNVVQQLRGHAAGVDRLAWSRDGRTLGSLDTRFQVRLWDVEEAKQVDVVSVPRPNGNFFAQNAALAISDDGRLLAYASGGERPARALIYDIAARKSLGYWELPGGYEQLTPAGPGRFLLVREQIDDDGQNVQTVVWQLEAGNEMPPHRVLRRSAPGDQRRYFESGLTPDGRLHWWTGPRLPPANYRVEVRRVETGKLLVPPLRLPSSEEVGVIGALIDPTGQLLWVGTHDDRKLYHLDDPQLRPTAARFPGAVTAGGAWMVISAQDVRHGPVGHLVMGGADRPWLVFANDDRTRHTIGMFSPDSRYLAFGSQSGTVTVIDLPALQGAVATFEDGQPLRD
jgi:WD40 repeat protein